MDARAAPDGFDADYSRAANPTILKANCKITVSKSRFVEGIKTWLVDFENGSWEVLGSDLPSKSWSLHFKGTTQAGRRNAEKAINLLKPKAKGGEWEKVLVVATDDSRQQLFVQPDKSKKQDRLEFCARKLRLACQEVGGDK
eukprot:4292142-Karenia_brevis.AAC.1